MTTRLIIFGLLTLGCGPQVALDDDDDDTGTAGAGSTGDGATSLSTTAPNPSTSGPAPGTTVTPDPTVVTTGGVSTDEMGEVDIGGFIDDGFDDAGCFDEPPDGTSFHCIECDVYAQDCPTGEKCMPWANDGGPAWNATRCSPIDSDPGQVDEACLVEGSGVSGIDDCDLGLMCFWVDPETNAGTCVAMCSGSFDAPICAEGHSCQSSARGVVNLCLQDCDPLVGDCVDGQCMPTNDGFVCDHFEPGDVPPGSPCDFMQECVEGSTCIDASLVGGCGNVSCCSSFCDLQAAEPDAACLPGQICTPWWQDAEAPEPWAHVGVCAVAP